MKIQELLEHHGISMNPFAEEDAQTDPVFKAFCRDATFHPVWDKVYGDPNDPATSIVFGEKGAGKTAMRMQIVGRINEHNASRKEGRVYIIEYDDFNPFLDHFADRLSARKQRDTAKVLAEWKLWDHMDAILSLAVTSLVDRLLRVPHPTGPDAIHIDPERLEKLDRQQQRDLLLLTACYDNSFAETSAARWQRLRKVLRFRNWKSKVDLAVGSLVSLAVLATVVYLRKWSWLQTPWPYAILAAGWFWRLSRIWKWHTRALRVAHNVRVLRHNGGMLRSLLMAIPNDEIIGQPLPSRKRTDDRYELLMKLQGVLRSLGHDGIIVLVDRVDEPHLITGSPERMKDLIWSMLDNKFLKQPGIGFKLLLPSELIEHLEKESRDFYQRARLDKQNMIPSLEWSGEALYDLANARIASCATADQAPKLRSLIDTEISDQRLVDAFRTLRTPRHLFKFLYRLLVAHANKYTDQQAVWQISPDTFEATLSVYRRDQQAVDRGLGAG